MYAIFRYIEYKFSHFYQKLRKTKIRPLNMPEKTGNVPHYGRINMLPLQNVTHVKQNKTSCIYFWQSSSTSRETASWPG